MGDGDGKRRINGNEKVPDRRIGLECLTINGRNRQIWAESATSQLPVDGVPIKDGRKDFGVEELVRRDRHDILGKHDEIGTFSWYQGAKCRFRK